MIGVDRRPLNSGARPHRDQTHDHHFGDFRLSAVCDRAIIGVRMVDVRRTFMKSVDVMMGRYVVMYVLMYGL